MNYLRFLINRYKHLHSRRVISTIIWLLPLVIAGCHNLHWRLNQEGAIDSLVKIREAEVTFKKSAGRYGTLKELAAARLLDSSIASGTRQGYRIDVRPKEQSYVAVAMPVEYGENAYKGTGSRSFYLDSSGIIRSGDKKGAEADLNDPPVGDRYQPKD